MLTEKTVIVKTEIDVDGNVFVKTVTQIFRDGSLVAVSSPHRTALEPGDSLPVDAPQQLVEITKVVWTPALKAARKVREAAAVAALPKKGGA